MRRAWLDLIDNVSAGFFRSSFSIYSAASEWASELWMVACFVCYLDICVSLFIINTQDDLCLGRY